MIRTAIFVTSVTLSGFALAQAPQLPVPAAPKAAAEPSSYCRSGAAVVLASAGEAEIATVQQVCRRGDIIAINAASQGSVFAIGRLCDFSKSIVNAGGQVVCSLGAPRGVR